MFICCCQSFLVAAVGLWFVGLLLAVHGVGDVELPVGLAEGGHLPCELGRGGYGFFVMVRVLPSVASVRPPAMLTVPPLLMSNVILHGFGSGTCAPAVCAPAKAMITVSSIAAAREMNLFV